MVDQLKFPWTHDTELVIKQLGEKSSVLKMLHLNEQEKYAKYDTYCYLPSIVLPLLIASLQMYMEQGALDTEVFGPVLAGFNILSACIIGFTKQMKFSVKKDCHKTASIAYGKLYRKIIGELAIKRKYRSEANVLLPLVRDQFDACYERSPIISKATVRHFLRRIGSTELALPDICNGLTPIEIAKNGTTPTSHFEYDHVIPKENELIV
tara:strand:- start:776 stop:1402 length:627 start_codon:yes stop_codon:yes gene_type:complete